MRGWLGDLPLTSRVCCTNLTHLIEIKEFTHPILFFGQAALGEVISGWDVLTVLGTKFAHPHKLQMWSLPGHEIQHAYLRYKRSEMRQWTSKHQRLYLALVCELLREEYYWSGHVDAKLTALCQGMARVGSGGESRWATSMPMPEMPIPILNGKLGRQS